LDRDAEVAPALLRHRPFAYLWFSRVLANVGFHMQGVAVGWQLYALTGSAFDLGLVGLAQFLPMVVLTLAAGQVADRCDRRLTAAICVTAEAAAAGMLAVAAAMGWQSKAGLLAIVAIVGAVRSFESPAVTALVPEVVPRPRIARAMAWVVSANQTAQIVGPAVGGVLYAVGPHVSYAAAGVLFGISAMCIAAVQRRRAAPLREPVTMQTVFSGIAFIWSRPVLVGTMSLDLFAVLLGGATALLPIYARDILDAGPAGLGLLRSAPAVGALATSLYLARHPLRRQIGSTLFRAVIAFGAATAVFGASTHFGVSLAALAILGGADVVSVVLRSSLVQFRTPDAMRGRVSAVHSLFTGTSNQLGAFESGVAAALLGTVPAVLLGGLGTIGVAVLWMRLFPELRRLRTFEE
jgi:MFS family permease